MGRPSWTYSTYKKSILRTDFKSNLYPTRKLNYFKISNQSVWTYSTLKKYYKDSEALDYLLRDEVLLPLLRKRSKNASVLFKESGLLSIGGHFQSTGIPVCSMF